MKQNIKKIKTSKLKIGPIRQTILPEGFIVRVQKYKEILSEVELTFLEATISNFQRDLNLERELEIWEKIAEIYKELTEKDENLSLSYKKELYKDILLASFNN